MKISKLKLDIEEEGIGKIRKNEEGEDEKWIGKRERFRKRLREGLLIIDKVIGRNEKKSGIRKIGLRGMKGGKRKWGRGVEEKRIKKESVLNMRGKWRRIRVESKEKKIEVSKSKDMLGV